MKLKRFLITTAAYLLVTFPVAVLWHLVIFEEIYTQLAIWTRAEPIVEIGFFTILIQGVIFALLYPRYLAGNFNQRQTFQPGRRLQPARRVADLERTGCG